MDGNEGKSLKYLHKTSEEARWVAVACYVNVGYGGKFSMRNQL